MVQRSSDIETSTDNLSRHKAIIGYLSSIGSLSCVTILREELGLQAERFPDSAVQQYGGLLQKKWTGAMRLQKRVSTAS